MRKPFAPDSTFVRACFCAEVEARERGFPCFAHALRVLRVAEEHKLSCADAEAFIDDMENLPLDEARRETHDWFLRRELSRLEEGRSEAPV